LEPLWHRRELVSLELRSFLRRSSNRTVPGVLEVQFWSRPFPFQHGDLLSEGEDFEGGIASTANEDSNSHNEGEDDLEHESILLTRRKRSFAGPTRLNRKLLISSHHGLLSTDRHRRALAKRCGDFAAAPESRMNRPFLEGL
jgi:hypothetical protein